MKAPPCAFNEIVGKIGALTLEVRTPLPAEELEARLMAFFGDRKSTRLNSSHRMPSRMPSSA